MPYWHTSYTSVVRATGVRGSAFPSSTEKAPSLPSAW